MGQQVLLREKETELELSKNLVSEKQELISKLEENLARCQSELAERENKLNDAFQVEVHLYVNVVYCSRTSIWHVITHHDLQASIKMEIEKQKKIISSLKVVLFCVHIMLLQNSGNFFSYYSSLLDSIVIALVIFTFMIALLRIFILQKKNEVLAKEKEELSKDKQGLLKQIEDLKSSTGCFFFFA